MKKFIIYTDGASRGNPGKASLGVVFQNEKEQTIKEYAEFLSDNMTNNEAEYQAVIFALKKFKALFGKEIAKTAELEIRSDSELMVKQLRGEYKLVNENIQKFFIEIWNLKIDFKNVKFKQIPREKNKQADLLANQALDSRPQTLL